VAGRYVRWLTIADPKQSLDVPEATKAGRPLE